MDLEEDDYEIEEEDYSDEDGRDGIDELYANAEEENQGVDEKNYTVLSEDDIRKRQEEDIREVTTLLSLSKDSASILLRYYKWNADKVQEAWFVDEEKVRSTVGLFERPVVLIEDDEPTCNICFETYPVASMDAASCGHLFCNECWTGYLSTSITDCPGCLTLRCPDPRCKAAIDQNMINKLASDDDKEKYARYLVRSYVESNPKTKWCPGPGCDNAVDCVQGSRGYDVNCTCSYTFCWNCTEDAHRPVDCDTVAKWIFKNTDEAENTTWLLVNSKPCPQCRRPIEKNMGCMRMTCRPPCGYMFCWLCLNAWSTHGYSPCNAYKKEEQSDTVRKRAKMSPERYHHYFERWTANHKSRQKALADLGRMRNIEIEKLYKKNCDTKEGLEFIKEAWRQIVECRRVLKWSYAYGFYIPEDENVKLKLFEYVQGEAESALERLHYCAENELKVYLDTEVLSENFIEFNKRFNEFRNKLEGLTKVTRKYFQDLVQALENDLSDVKRQDTNWYCEHCTFANSEFSIDCQMCVLPRIGSS